MIHGLSSPRAFPTHKQLNEIFYWDLKTESINHPYIKLIQKKNHLLYTKGKSNITKPKSKIRNQGLGPLYIPAQSAHSLNLQPQRNRNFRVSSSISQIKIWVWTQNFPETGSKATVQNVPDGSFTYYKYQSVSPLTWHRESRTRNQSGD
jgi:hypothetical protein